MKRIFLLLAFTGILGAASASSILSTQAAIVMNVAGTEKGGDKEKCKDKDKEKCKDKSKVCCKKDAKKIEKSCCSKKAEAKTESNETKN